MTTVVQIRGTSGSGKTTVVRNCINFDNWDPVYVDGRRKPLYYRRDSVAVMGHYEIDCGGCDTIGSAPKVYDAIQELPKDLELVVSEELLWSEDVKWTESLLEEGYSVVAIFLTTSFEEYMRRVGTRQVGRKPKDPERVRRKLETRIGTIDRARQRLYRNDSSRLVCRRFKDAQAATALSRLLSQYTNPE